MTRQTTFARCTGVRRLIISRYSVLLAALIVSASFLSSVRVEAGHSDLDPSFNGSGIVVTQNNEFEQINDIVIQPDGKIVAVGRSGISHEGDIPRLDIMVTRYNTDGSLDTTFGSGGIVTTSIFRDDTAMAVALQQDGRIVVAGTATLGSFSRFTLIRYNTDGSLDATFGFGGIVDERRMSSQTRSMDLAIQSDGKIVVAGQANFSSPKANFTAILVRYETDGSRDVTFGDRGLSRPVPAGFAVSPMVSFNSIALQPDQKIVVAGDCGDFPFFSSCLSRYNPDGSLDNTFNGNGLVAGFGASSEDGQAVSLQPDGKIIAAGQSVDPFFGYVPVVVRFNTDGSFDASFRFDSTAIFDFGQFRVKSLALKPNGKILIVGERFFDSSQSAIGVANCSSNGVVEEIITTPIGMHAAANAVALQPDGRIVVGGYGGFFTHDGATFSALALVRYGPNNPPVVTISDPASGSVFAVNTPIHFAGSFTDDEGDTHTAEFTFESITQPAEVFEFFGSSGIAQTSHTFTEAGVYKVSLKVTDNEFLSSTSTTVNDLDAFVVIYDPNGGFVAGGGWINSPQGAFALVPALTGKATFGFVSMYQNGASVPDGNTKFQFKAGDLDFESTSYEWLVVSGGRKAQFKGIGTLNGSGGYRFMLTCIDGDQPGGDGQDKFRIRIWGDSDGLIYDNQLNAPDADDPTTVLGGGSIVIHR
jgi:uncharacterized delta-60 repeat protein